MLRRPRAGHHPDAVPGDAQVVALGDGAGLAVGSRTARVTSPATTLADSEAISFAFSSAGASGS